MRASHFLKRFHVCRKSLPPSCSGASLSAAAAPRRRIPPFNNPNLPGIPNATPLQKNPNFWQQGHTPSPPDIPRIAKIDPLILADESRDLPLAQIHLLKLRVA